MPNSMPEPKLLLKTVVKYLETELFPSLEGYHRFETRVTINVLNTLRRELEMRAAQAHEERVRLIAMLGHDGEADALSKELCEKIRAGSIALDDPALRAHIRQSLQDALLINNPKWLDR